MTGAVRGRGHRDALVGGELIKTRRLDAGFAEQLDASVRQGFLDLERAVRAAEYVLSPPPGEG